jgi:transposase
MSGQYNAQAPLLLEGKTLSVPINPLSPELNPICYLLALLAHDFLHVDRIRVKSLTLR